MIKWNEVRVADLGPLTRREAEALLWVAEGKTAWEAGAIMGVAESTAVAHIKAATEKLNASTRPHLVCRAFLFGILQRRIMQAGTALLIAAAIILRLPGSCYQPMYRCRTRRRDEDHPTLVIEAPRRNGIDPRNGRGRGTRSPVRSLS